MNILIPILRRVLRIHEGDEVSRNQVRTLMDQLIEGMLSVGACLAPEDLAGLGGNRGTIPTRALAVGLHGQLLQVGWEAVEVLVVRQDRVALSAEEVVVPDIDEAHQHDRVLFNRRIHKVGIHCVEAVEEVLKYLGAKGDDQRETDRGVNGVTAADPTPEAEGIIRVDTKVCHCLEVRGDCHKVMLGGIRIGAGVSLSLQALKQPGPDLTCIGHGLQRRKGLGDDDNEGRLGIKAFELLCSVIRIDVRDIVHRNAGIRIGL